MLLFVSIVIDFLEKHLLVFTSFLDQFSFDMYFAYLLLVLIYKE